MAGDGNFTPSATHARVWPSKALTGFCKGNPDHWVFRNSLSANKDTRKHIRQAYFLLFRPLGFRDFPGACCVRLDFHKVLPLSLRASITPLARVERVFGNTRTKVL